MGCNDITPCVDCPWTLLLLTGQPIFIMYCERCRHWYQAAEASKVKDTSPDSGYQVLPYGPKNHVTSLLHCDALASNIFIQRRRYCGYCDTISRTTITYYSNTANLGAIITNLTDSSYKNSNFPAYTFLHRCGAHEPYTKSILKIRPEMAAKVMKHRDKRLMEQHRFEKKILPLTAEADKKRGLE